MTSTPDECHVTKSTGSQSWKVKVQLTDLASGLLLSRKYIVNKFD